MLQCESDLKARNNQASLDIDVMEGQLQDLRQELAFREQSNQDALQEHAQLEGDVMATAAATRGVYADEVERANGLATLRLRRDQLRSAVQNARGEEEVQRRLASEAENRERQLQGLLEEQAEQFKRLQEECETLNRLAQSPRPVKGNNSTVLPSVGAGFLSHSPHATE